MFENNQPNLLATILLNRQMTDIFSQVVHKPTVFQLVNHNALIYSHNFLLWLAFDMLPYLLAYLILRLVNCDWGYLFVLFDVGLTTYLLCYWFFTSHYYGWVYTSFSLLVGTCYLVFYHVLVGNGWYLLVFCFTRLFHGYLWFMCWVVLGWFLF